jgi:hypothetical protein
METDIVKELEKLIQVQPGENSHEQAPTPEKQTKVKLTSGDILVGSILAVTDKGFRIRIYNDNDMYPEYTCPLSSVLYVSDCNIR